jgi:hypothetical protein
LEPSICAGFYDALGKDRAVGPVVDPCVDDRMGGGGEVVEFVGHEAEIAAAFRHQQGDLRPDSGDGGDDHRIDPGHEQFDSGHLSVVRRPDGAQLDSRITQ